MICKLIAVVLTGSAALLSASAFADTFPPISTPAYAIQYAGISSTNAQYMLPGTFGSFSARAPLSASTGPVTVSTSAYGGNDPSVSAASELFGAPGGYVGQRIYADAGVEFYFEVAGPANGYASVNIAGSGGAQSSRPSEQAEADFLVGERDIFPPDTIVNLDACTLFPSCASSFPVNQTFVVATDVPYDVLIQAFVDTGSTEHTVSFHASAFVDPTITLDPSDSSGDTLLFSPGVGAFSSSPSPVPEPSSLLLFSTGALGLAAALRRR